VTTPHPLDPLDPLSAEEIRTATAVLARERGVARAAWRSAAIAPVEPTPAGSSAAGSKDGA
jgi:Cu2+-containing amine oxidase